MIAPNEIYKQHTDIGIVNAIFCISETPCISNVFKCLRMLLE